MTQNEVTIRSSVNDLIQREKESNMFKKKLEKILRTPLSLAAQEKYAARGIFLNNGTLSDAITASLIIQALNGNITAYTTIRDTMGHKPVDQVKNDVVVRIDMSPKARELGE